MQSLCCWPWECSSWNSDSAFIRQSAGVTTQTLAVVVLEDYDLERNPWSVNVCPGKRAAFMPLDYEDLCDDCKRRKKYKR